MARTNGTSITRFGGREAPVIALSDEDRQHLESIVSAGSSLQRDACRARMILLAAQGKTNVAIGTRLGKHPDTVGRWRKRFAKGGPTALSDLPRPGRPPRHSAETKAKVLQAATEAPREHGIAITHWSSTALAHLAKEAGIDAGIHPTTIWRWLEDADIKPHRRRMWMKKTDPNFEARMTDVTATYLAAPEWAQCGIPVFCVDEKTGIQALERKHRLPVRPGKPEYVDPHYARHGTLCLTAGFEVATGQARGILTPKRPAAVFAQFIQELCEDVAGAPQVHFVLDQLNTHWHHDVCKVVAEFSGVEYDPRKHKKGVQRKAFLSNTEKRIIFHYTPKHASWLNQIEIWFSTLTRKAISRGSFSSTAELSAAIVDFIAYYNRVLAHPYKWTYTGTPCRA